MEAKRIHPAMLLGAGAVILVVLSFCCLGCSRSRRTQDKATLFQMMAIRTALSSFQVDCGRFPTDAEGLRALLQNPGVVGWRGPYLETNTSSPASLFTDEWGTPLHYVAENGSVRVLSAGPDRVFGTADDLTQK